jgi:hypothetical protein
MGNPRPAKPPRTRQDNHGRMLRERPWSEDLDGVLVASGAICWCASHSSQEVANRLGRLLEKPTQAGQAIRSRQLREESPVRVRLDTSDFGHRGDLRIQRWWEKAKGSIGKSQECGQAHSCVSCTRGGEPIRAAAISRMRPRGSRAQLPTPRSIVHGSGTSRFRRLHRAG